MESTITCPECGHQETERIPEGACLFFYECVECGDRMRPEESDCCVFCSYGDRPCPTAAERKGDQTDKGA